MEQAEHNDLLSMLMEARDADTGAGMSDHELCNEIILLMFAGHETTAVALTWAFYLLSQHPEIERRLHAELDEVLGGRAPVIDDLPNLSYTRMVIDETLRLYPPAWGVTRQSLADDEVGGYRIPGKTGVSIIFNFNNVHRDPRWWERPEQFDPERFLPERAASRPQFAYLPFGAGQRMCIGSTFALTEAQLVLATVAQRYAPRLVAGHSVTPSPIFTLRPGGGVPMLLYRRATGGRA